MLESWGLEEVMAWFCLLGKKIKIKRAFLLSTKLV